MNERKLTIEKLADDQPRAAPVGTDLSTKVYDLLAKDYPTEDEFRLLLTHVSPGVLAKRYLLSGLPYVFKGQPHKYLAFREAVARIFGVPPQDIAVMGSARFGFSTNPNKHTNEGAKGLDENSDMDLVIISKEIFHNSLESFARWTFTALRSEAGLTSDEKAPQEKIPITKRTMLAIRRRSKGFFYGYVNPSDLEDNTAEKQRFYDMKRESGTQLFGTAPPGPINRVGAWIYRDWDAAERMYEFSFRQTAKAWGVGRDEDSDSSGDLDEGVAANEDGGPK